MGVKVEFPCEGV